MFVLMGSNGNITSRAARALLADGHRIRVVARQPESLAALRAAGAEAAIGDAQDPSFLARAFAGATAAYVMIPPAYDAPDMRHAHALLGTAIARAIEASGVGRVVSLSSIGAELASGTGPIAGLHDQERRLDAIARLDLLHLRAGYFMENHLHAIGVIAQHGVYASLERSDVAVPMVDVGDIATVVARELAQPTTRGVLQLHALRHYTFQEVAAILGREIGRPDLEHVQASPSEAKAAMVGSGMSPDAADQMEAMARWLSGNPSASLASAPVAVVPTTLEQFAPRFGAAFRSMRVAA
jgi:uncharacterized protein YbjT (DUF2867 family)